MKRQFVSLVPILIFVLLVILVEAASSASKSKVVHVHTIDADLITLSEEISSDRSARLGKNL